MNAKPSGALGLRLKAMERILREARTDRRTRNARVWYHSPMSKSDSVDAVKETCRLIRLARSYWDAHRNHACRTHRDMAMKLYEILSKEQKEEIPQVLRVWLRYRSEKYFGPSRTAPGTGGRKKKR